MADAANVQGNEPPETASGNLAVRQAGIADIPAVSAILDTVRTWMTDRGITLWMDPATGAWFLDEAWLRPRLAAGEVWIAGLDGEPVAIVRVLWSDPAVWGERETGDAAYLHTLAVRRDRAGEGLGRRVLRWAEGFARENGKRRLRLDCVATIPALVAYYDAAGFARAGTARAGNSDLVLFEKVVAADGGVDSARPWSSGN